MAGSNAIRKAPWSNTGNSEWQIGQQWSGAYNIVQMCFYRNILMVVGVCIHLFPNNELCGKFSLGGTDATNNNSYQHRFFIEQDLLL